MTNDNQEITKKVYEWFKDIAGPKVALRGLLKVLAVASAKLSFPRLFLEDCAPSGHFKTWTSEKASLFFPKSWTLDLKSDFTMNGLYEDTKGKVNGQCFRISDGTLWLSSKAERTKQRNINGMSELMTDEVYKYRDWQKVFFIRGRISLILNLTTESYNHNLKNLLGNTFDERCLTFFSELSQEEFNSISTNRLLSIPHTRVCMSKSSRKVDVEIPSEFKDRIRMEASEYSWRAVKGYPRTQATVNAMLRANAYLNGRAEVSENDFWIVEQIKSFLINPLQPNKPRIIQMLRNKQSILDICKALNMIYESYNSYIYRVLNEAKAKGLLT